MEIVVILIVIFCLISIACSIYLWYYWYQGTKKDKIDDLVSQINRSHQMLSEYDQNNQQNIMNLEKNVSTLYKATQGFDTQVKMAINEMKGVSASNASPDVLSAKSIRFADRFNITNVIKNTSTANSSAENWMQISPISSNETGGGVIVNTLKSLNGLDVNGAVTINGSTKLNDDVSVAGSMILEGNNKWILHTPENGDTSMYIAAFSNNTWDWNNQYAFQKNGVLRTSGGLATKGGKSTLNPNNSDTIFNAVDGSNYIRGNTQVAGNMDMLGVLGFAKKDPGAMIEKTYSTNEAYGIGQYENGTFRMYAGTGNKDGSVNLSLKTNNNFFDAITVNNDQTIDINAPTNIHSTFQTKSFAVSSDDKNKTLRFVPGQTPGDIVDIYGSALGQEKKIGGFKGDGSFCLGNMCIREKLGNLQVCNSSGNLCKSVVLSDSS